MTPEQFARVEQLFDAACRLPPGERAEFIAQQTPDDAEVLAAVRALLAEDERGAAGADALSRKLAAERDDAGVRQRLLVELAAASRRALAPPAGSGPSVGDSQAGLAEGPGSHIGPYKPLQ